MMNKKYLIIKIVILGVCLLVAVWYLVFRTSISESGSGLVEVDGGQRVIMGTYCRVVAVAENEDTAKKCIEAAFKKLRDVDAAMSVQRDDSEISEINRNAFNEPVRISKPTFAVLQKAIEFSKLTDGAFDVTLGPLVDLWDSAAKAGSVPSDTELQQVRSKIGYEKLILDAEEMTVRFAVEGMAVDFGGIAKGYSIDAGVEVMQESGAVGGMIDAGGDIRCFGIRPKGKTYWLLGLQDPDKANDTGENQMKSILKLTDAAIATSGDYRRFTLIAGKKYSHIIDSKTGYGSDRLASVTIISQNAIDADVLATAVSVMGSEKGLPLIEGIPETEAILISSQPRAQVTKTSGADKYVVWHEEE